MKNLARVRPSGVVCSIALFVALSGVAVADDDIKGDDNVKNNAISSKEVCNDCLKGKDIKESTLDLPGVAGRGGGGGAGGDANASFNYRVDAPTNNAVIYVGKGFQLRASCQLGSPHHGEDHQPPEPPPKRRGIGGGGNDFPDVSLFLDSTENNLAFTQIGSQLGNDATVNDTENENFDVADADEDLLAGTVDVSTSEESNAEAINGVEDDVIDVLNVRPLTGTVTTVTYTVDTTPVQFQRRAEQGFDCSITGNAVRQG